MLRHRLLAAAIAVAHVSLGPVISVAHAQEPTSADGWRISAREQAAQGNMTEAEKSIDQAHALEPANRDIQIARANILLWLGKPEEAAAQANAVRMADPSYPGLFEFDAALSRQGQHTTEPGLLSVTAVFGRAGLKFASGRKTSWKNAVIAAAFGRREGAILTAEIDAERREQTDVRFAARVTARTASGAVYLGAGITPQAAFRDDWRIEAGGNAALARDLQGSMGLRIAHFGTGVTTAIEPGVTYNLSPSLSAGVRMINLLDEQGHYRAGGAFRVDHQTTEAGTVFAAMARYPDTEAGITRTLQAYSLGATWALNPHWRLRVAAANETRQSSYRNRSVNIGLEYRFDSK